MNTIFYGTKGVNPGKLFVQKSEKKYVSFSIIENSNEAFCSGIFIIISIISFFI